MIYEKQVVPSKRGRWAFVIVLLLIIGPGQLIVGIPALVGSFAIIEGLPADPGALEAGLIAFAQTEIGLLAQLLATALAMGLTVVVAMLWPRYWARRTGQHYGLDVWLGGRDPLLIKMWMVPVVVVVMLVIVGLFSLLFDNAAVDVQAMLFSTPLLAIVSALVVVSVVPFAEEFVFRGALYNALLSDEEVIAPRPDRRTHVAAFIVAMIAFAALHLLAGFTNAGAIVSVFILSAFLTALRTVSHSVWPAVMAHMLWNGIAALAFITAL